MSEVLPRREALWVLAGITLVVAPHAAHLPAWLSGTVAGLIAWRLTAALGVLPLPGRWLLFALALACAAAILAAYHTLFGREAGVAMLTLMLGLKLLEMRSRRDGVLAVFLGLFVVLTHLLYGQGMALAAYLLAVVAVFLATLALIAQPSLISREGLRLAGVLLGQALPLMVVLFLLFPRLPGPLWGLPRDAHAGLTGLSETMTPGSISRLVQSDAVAFRVEFEGRPPPAAQRYWRGPVLEFFDGRSWLPHRGGGAEPFIEAEAPGLAYTVTLEPHGKPWVFALDLPDPLALPPGTRLSPAGQVLAAAPVERRMRLKLVSHLRHRMDARGDAEALARALQLPAAGNTQARQFAARLRASAGSDRAFIAAVLAFFRREPFHYTLTPPLLNADAVDEFLFRTRRGFCEHYAGAFTFLMRAAGVPARVVTGYQGGEFNRLGGYLIVRQSDAHAWSEVWLPGEGWVRVDPTAQVAAGRIEQGLAAALPAGEPLPLLMRADAAWLKTLRLHWDALSNRWNQWVIGFDQERQLALMASLGMGLVSWRELAGFLAAAMAVATTVLAWFVLRGRPRRDPVQMAWERFCRRLARVGLTREGHEGPLAYAERVAARRPDLAATVQAIAEGYARLRYGPPAPPAEVRRWRQQVAAFRPRRAGAPAPGRP